ncbi:FxSxx-COOH system tetratricopeptide repeat protein [Pseudofrankia inefficax]|uniref:Putative ATP/GTP binding protein n=1 Tax=Pseudofrankia inefficax (strain DSM 45817 / CECT 9037 / DDB 130130 / EuI1c) TaxID=298654 RepID=E3J972_PSEI1|nr:FxSxx-COOH system tetratricopeptide repeat protein [Pseudofrankia inefficax]ADP80951.1 putative ATP/GTP binding protein [Pseudofrankia inefficax]
MTPAGVPARGQPVDPRDLADALWLAAVAADLPPPAPRAARGDDETERSGPDPASSRLTGRPGREADRASPRDGSPGSPAGSAPAVDERAGDQSSESSTRDRGTSTRPRSAGWASARRRRGGWSEPAPPTLESLVTQWREVHQALNVARQWVPSSRDVVLDDEATARHLADGHWRPVYRPVPERRWSLTLVVDDNWTMSVWQSLVPRLVAMLERLGVFEDVRLCFLDTDVDDARDLRLRGSRRAPNGFSPSRLLEPPGRRVIWVLTDGMGTAWRRGLAGRAVWTWARRLPVALLGAVPRSTLRYTGLEENQGLRPVTDGQAIAVPLLEPHPTSLARWAARLTQDGAGGGELPTVLVSPAPPEPGPPTGDGGDPARGPALPRRQVDAFRSAASPVAFDLATHLAAAPITRSTLRPLLRMVEGPPGRTTAALSELFAHGLLYPVAGSSADETDIAYEFAPGLRERLLPYCSRAETARVLRTVSADLGPKVTAVRHLAAALLDPDGVPIPAVTPETEDFVAVEAVAFAALSGPYLPRARRLQAALAQPTPAPIGRVPAVWGRVPPRNPRFTGREELLEEVRVNLRQRSAAPDVPAAITGMVGVGKTQVATEYTYRFSSDYDIVWWISAEHSTLIAASLMDLGRELNMDVGTEADSAVRRVVDALRAGQPYSRWLLVFDNANEIEMVRNYFPTGTAGDILIVARNTAWLRLARCVEVGPFTRSESIEMLRLDDRLDEGIDLPVADADRLAAALGDLPLAVDQASIWCRETGMPVGEYLRLFEDRNVNLAGSLPAYDISIDVAWSLALDRIEQSSPSACRIAQLVAFLAPLPIRRKFLFDGLAALSMPEFDAVPLRPVEMARAVGDLNRYGLTRVGPGDDTILMQTLVQPVVVNRMPPGERDLVRGAARALLAVGDPGTPDDPAAWPLYAELYPHLLATDAADSGDPRVRETLVNEVIYLFRWGDHERSLELATQVHETWEQTIGEEAPEMVRLAGWLGRLHHANGHYDEAARINSRALELCARVHGDAHPETLLAMGNRVADLVAAGDFHGCLELADERSRRATEALGPRDPATLVAAHDVGAALRLVGRYDEARRADQETWSLRAAVLGENNLDTLRTVLGLTIGQRETGDYVGAPRRQERIVERLVEAVGGRRDHIDVLTAQNQLAVALRKAGLHAEALRVARDVRTQLDRRYGRDHPRTIAASLALSAALSADLRNTGNLSEARELAEEALGRCERAFGPPHPHTRAAAVSLALAVRHCGDVARAVELDTVSLDVLADRLGPDHPYTLAAAANLASDLFAAGEFERALERDQDTIVRCRRTLGGDHPETLLITINLAQDLRALDRAEEGVRLNGATVERLTRVLGAQHQAVKNATAWMRSDFDIDPEQL